MLFNSIEFVIFLPFVIILYWSFFYRNSVNLRNLFLLVASYTFYGWWDYRFLGLIVLSSTFDFFCGKLIYESRTLTRQRAFLILSLSVNLTILFFFKYFDFFAASFVGLLGQMGYVVHPITLKIILPVGVSFYTFQALSYTIDIYKKRMNPTYDALAFFTFISFFPQLVAGPIERARNLLPQFSSLKKFDYILAANGFRQLLWGFFAKIVVADSIAPITDSIFANYQTLGAGTLFIGAILFSIQLYGDFSGYSNIAIGIAFILGFNLTRNFNLPYFSRNISEFWTRWHISLSTWFREYVYFPLGGNKCSSIRHSFNIMTTFLVSGLWHGANWTFVIWGSIHGFFYLITKPFSLKEENEELRLRHLLSMIGTFLLVCVAFVFFRADNIEHALVFFDRIIRSEKGIGVLQLMKPTKFFVAIFFASFLFVTEWIQREKRHAMDIGELPLIFRHGVYYMLIITILFAFQTDRTFIYFQF